ncbi:MAG: hypothetical protein EXR79_03955 [Myxococcales bacterium]|nr:hypothetical protein [Myxococcales bacterium]
MAVRRTHLPPGVTRLLHAAYLLAVQATVGLLTFALFGWFAVNSPSTPRRLGALVSNALPGDLAIGRVRWGPGLDHFRVDDVVVTDPHGARVLAVRRAEAWVGIGRVLLGLALGDRTLSVRVEQLELDGLDVRVRNDRMGRLTLATAFADPDEPPPPEPPRPFRLDVVASRVRGLAMAMDLPGSKLDVVGVDFDGAMQFRSGEGPVHVGWQFERLVGRRIEMAYASMKDLPPIPPAFVRVDRVEGSLERVRLRGVDCVLDRVRPWHDIALPDTALVSARIDMELKPELSVDASHLRMETSTASTFLGPMLGRLFDCRLGLDGGFHFDLAHGFVAEADVTAAGLLAGFDVRVLRGHVWTESAAPGNTLTRVRTTNLDLRGYGGAIRAPWIDYTMTKDDLAHLVRGRFTFDRVAPPTLLAAPGAGAFRGGWLLFLQGALSGDVGVAVRTRLTPLEEPNVEVDLALDCDLDLERSGIGVPLRDVVPTLFLRGGIGFHMGPGRVMANDFHDVLLHTGESRTHSLTDPVLQRAEWVRLDGSLELAGPGSHFTLAAHVPRIERLAPHLGVTGRVELGNTQVRGPMQSPDVVGELRVHNVVAAGIEVASARTLVRVKEGTVWLDGFKAQTSLGSIAADIKAHVLGATLAQTPSRRTVAVRGLEVRGLDLGSVLPRFGTPGIAGVVDLRGASVEMDLGDPMASLRLHGALDVVGFDGYGERLPKLSAHLGMHGRRLTVTALRATLETGDDVTGSAEVDLSTMAWRVDADLPVLPMKTWHAVEKLDLPMQGALGGRLQAEGNLKDFALEADLQIVGLQWGERPAAETCLKGPIYALGDATLHIVKPRGGDMSLTSESFFPHFKLAPGSTVAFAGLKPTEVMLRIASDGPFDPGELSGCACAGELFGMDCAAGVAMKVDVETDVQLDFRPGARPFGVEARFRPGGLMVDFGADFLPLTNLEKTEVAVVPGAIRFAGALFDLGRNQFEMCGEYRLGNPTQAQPPEMLVFVAGTLDLQPLQRMGSLGKSLSGLDLRFAFQRHPAVTTDVRHQCLRSLRGGGAALRVEGPLDDLRIDGSLRAEAGRVSLRRMPDLAVLEGGRLDIESRGSRTWLRIPHSHRLQATMEDGKVWLWGEVELHALKPDRIDLHVGGADMPVPGVRDFSATLSPALRFEGSGLADPVEREMKLTGAIDVSEASYRKSADKFASIVGGVTGREVEAASKPLAETFPEACELKLGIDARGRNVEVQMKFGVARTDLLAEFDLRVEGTPCEPRLRNRVTLVAGPDSQVALANNTVFEIERGTLDFTGDPLRPFVDVAAKASIHTRNAGGQGRLTGLGEDLNTSGSQTSGQKVNVTASVTGYLTGDTKNLKLRFASDQGDSDADVQSLIVTGRRRSDTAAGGGSGFQLDLFNDLAQFGMKQLEVVLGFVLPFAKLNLGTFVDETNFYVDTANGVIIEATKRLGRVASAGARVVPGLAGQSPQYTGNFQFRFMDNLSFNGLLSRTRPIAETQSNATVDVFEGKLRYKVPLD